MPVNTFLPGVVDGDAQETTGRAFNLYQFIAQSGHGFFNNLLQCHAKKVFKFRVSLIDRPKKTGGENPPVWS
jgi:hypothetical protein